MLGIYYTCVKTFHWSLKEIDETDLETLMDFLFYREEEPDTRVINGKIYRRSDRVPGWL